MTPIRVNISSTMVEQASPRRSQNAHISSRLFGIAHPAVSAAITRFSSLRPQNFVPLTKIGRSQIADAVGPYSTLSCAAVCLRLC